MDYEIIFSKRKTISLSVKRDKRIVVRAPFHTPKSRIDNFVQKNAFWISQRQKYYDHAPSIDDFTSEQIKELKTNLQRIITPILSEYSYKMRVSPNKVSINTTKTRFGSCSSNGNLNFSCRLALYPQKAIEYVCVHELAHLKEMNHSSKFWSIVEAQLPDYKEAKKLLK